MGDSQGQSQQPSPTPRETTDQNQAPRNENQTKANTDQRGTEQFPFFVKIIGAEPKTENAAEPSKSKDERNATDWWMFWATVGIGFIGFLQFIAFVCQAIYMRRSVAELRGTTAASIQAARATENAANDALKHSHKVERAYISGGGFRRFLPQAVGPDSREARMVDTGKFEFHVNNYGKTQGTIFQIGWRFCETTSVPNVEPIYQLKYFDSRINPGTSGLPLEVIGIPPSLISPAVYGRVYYETIFGERFSSGFLYWIPPIWKGSESIAPPNPRYTDEREESCE